MSAAGGVRVHAIETGKVLVRERQRRGEGAGATRALRTMLDRRWTEPLPILAFLVEHPEGLILVDTGETARAAEPGYFPRWHPYFRLGVRVQVTPEQEIGPQLKARGFEPREVGRVVLTHLHTDHAGGLHHLPESEILVSGTELELASGTMGKLRGYLPHRWPPWLAPSRVELEPEPFGPFARSRALTEAGDVVLLPTPGHTPGHLSVAVRVEGSLVVLAGDASYAQELMVEGVPDGVTSDVATATRTLELLRELAAAQPTVYLPSHDADAARRLEAMEPVRL